MLTALRLRGGFERLIIQRLRSCGQDEERYGDERYSLQRSFHGDPDKTPMSVANMERRRLKQME
jgi:hypothetical protein